LLEVQGDPHAKRGRTAEIGVELEHRGLRAMAAGAATVRM
jgi:hypothetical protein